MDTLKLYLFPEQFILKKNWELTEQLLYNKDHEENGERQRHRNKEDPPQHCKLRCGRIILRNVGQIQLPWVQKKKLCMVCKDI